MDITKIQVRNNEYSGGKKVKQIELFAGDLIFTSSVNSDRDIRLAERLADGSGVTLYRIDLEQEAKAESVQ